MRGASALQELLESMPGVRARVLVVWEPVLVTDVAPPTSSVLSRLTWPGTVQFYDRDLTLSKFMVESVRNDPSYLPPGQTIDEDMIVWDTVAIFPPGVRWNKLPHPTYYGAPVVDVLDEVRTALSAAGSNVVE